MKSICITLILFCFNRVTSFSQIAQLNGSIRDAKTNKPLAFANVFLNKTTMGAVADSSGLFLINHVQAGTYEIIASFIGYTPFRKSIEIKNEKYEIEIKLNIETNRLDEVTIQVKEDKEWTRDLKHFKRVFLGTNKEAKNCRIVNPWVLDFSYENASDGKIFKARASQPIEIENVYLGYRLFYYLENFSARGGAYSTVAYSFVGYERFEAMKTKDTTLYRHRRMNTYLGSNRHLFKSILEHRLEEEGFDLYIESEAKKDVYNPKSVSITNLIKIDASKIKVYKVEDQYLIELPLTEVHYKRKYLTESTGYATYDLEVSWLNPKNRFLAVYSNGVMLNSNDLIVAGVMFEKRVSSHLPYDYKPTIN